MNLAWRPQSCPVHSRWSRSRPPSWVAWSSLAWTNLWKIFVRLIPCRQFGYATTWMNRRQLRSMESSPFRILGHSLNNNSNIFWSNWLVTSPAEGDGSPSCSCFISPVPRLLQFQFQFNHHTFLIVGINCEKCSHTKEEQERNCNHPSLHDL